MPRHVSSPSSRFVAALALGVSLGWSCGGGSGTSCGSCGTTSCDDCLPGENLYECAISATNNRICAIDDLTADQHCAGIGSVVAAKIVCSVGDHGSGAPQPPPASPTGAADGADGADSTGTPNGGDDSGGAGGASAG